MAGSVHDTWVSTTFDVPMPQQAQGGVSLVALGTARLTWGTVRSKAVADIGQVKTAVAAAFANDAAQQAALTAALAKLDGLVQRFDAKLETALDALLNGSPAEREKLKPAIRKLLDGYMGFVGSDPLMASIDGNELVPSASIAAPMRGALGQVAAALG